MRQLEMRDFEILTHNAIQNHGKLVFNAVTKHTTTRIGVYATLTITDDEGSWSEVWFIGKELKDGTSVGDMFAELVG